MKKILVAVDGSYYSQSAIDYAIQIAKKQGSLIVGVFVVDLSYVYMFTNYGLEPQPYGLTTNFIGELSDEKEKELYKVIKEFNERCRSEGVKYKVHLDRGVPAYELIRESSYSDLIIIGYQTFFSNVEGRSDEGVLRDVLVDAECPVLIVPEKVRDINNVIFTFDGKTSSIYAIKMFTYLFEQTNDMQKYILLSVLKDKKEEIENEELLREYLRIHYPQIKFQKVSGDAEEEIEKFSESCPDCLVVMGAFGRSALSRLISSSTADNLLESRAIPAFISHK